MNPSDDHTHPLPMFAGQRYQRRRTYRVDGSWVQLGERVEGQRSGMRTCEKAIPKHVAMMASPMYIRSLMKPLRRYEEILLIQYSICAGARRGSREETEESDEQSENRDGEVDNVDLARFAARVSLYRSLQTRSEYSPRSRP